MQLMKPIIFLIVLFLIFNLSQAQAYDCSNAKPFIPVGVQKVHIYVGHFFWKTTGDGTREEVIEDVCATQVPAEVPILDIRGREEEWFYCSTTPSTLECSTTYQNVQAKIEIKPAIVIRGWNGSPALDHHFHAYITPGADPTRYFDLFSRSIRSELTPSPITLDAAGGGRGENSSVDSFYVRTDFE